MKRLVLFFSLVIICAVGCNKEEGLVGPSNVGTFDVTLGKSWMYKWEHVLSDSSGKIISSATDTILVRIAATNDSLRSFKGLIRFEAYSAVRYMGTSKVWYQFAGDSLVEVAYNVKGPSMALPKRGVRSSEKNENAPGITSLFPKSVLEMLHAKGFLDSVMFREDIRIVCKYPLSQGKMWTSFIKPFFQTREIVTTETLYRIGKIFVCAKIQTRIPEIDPTMEWFDYVAQEGLIERRIKIDNITITTAEKPEGLSYGSAYESLELIQ